MKKNLLFLFICILLIGCQESERSTNTEMSLTLKEAIEIAQKEALKWNKAAMLYNG
ncbi:MAG TPA: hypothetical protein GX525_08485, partial [Bacilli bacterium]|nr:hypothetical protein [Bacilli bacterium]